MAGNGDLPASALGYVSGHRVRVDLVAQTTAMVAVAAREGVVLRITQAYRSLAEQVSIFLARYSPRTTGTGPYGDVRWWNGARYVRTSGAAAAVPGTSNHGLGRAIDFATDSPGAIAWLTRNGSRFGWSRPAWTYQAGTVEPWHWEATYVLVSNPIGGTGTVPTVPDMPPLTPIEEDDIMAMTPEERAQLVSEIAGAVWHNHAPDADHETWAMLYRTAQVAEWVASGALTNAVSDRMKDILRSEEFQGYMRDLPWAHQIAVGEHTDNADAYLRDARLAPQVMAALAQLQGSAPSAGPATITDADLAAIAKAVQDEQDRRERDRLGSA